MSAAHAHAIARWLIGKDPMKVSEIAKSGCPVPVPDRHLPWDRKPELGGNKHVDKVNQALKAAMGLGLVERYKLGGSGAYYYRVTRATNDQEASMPDKNKDQPEQPTNNPEEQPGSNGPGQVTDPDTQATTNDPNQRTEREPDFVDPNERSADS